jgi:hypothetical protein
MYNVVSKTVDIGDFIIRGTVSKRKWEKSPCLWIDGFGKALKPLPVKTDADGKPMMHLPIGTTLPPSL